ncbi:MAG TPA: UbiA family prenyltransferase [Caulobacteraceae bacterium]|nr:UbiA family prenyltransferase [Caulobacteraceae bacterium]
MSKSDTVLPDAVPANWVDRHAPEALKPWLKLGRFDRPIGIWLLMLPGWQGIALAAAMAGDLETNWRFYLVWLALFAVGAALMRAAGCAWNDIVDRDIDAKVARTAARPIPSGRISVRGALAFVVVCCLVGLLILLSFNLVAIAIGAASLLLVAAYPFMKRITWWPQAWLGLTFNWGVLLGFAAAVTPRGVTDSLGYEWTMIAHSGFDYIARWSSTPLQSPGDPGLLEALHTGRSWLAALLLYASGVFWTLGYDTIYALQDIEDDAMVGVKSSARRLGSKASAGVLAFYLAACFLAAMVWLAGGGPQGSLGPLFFPPFALFAAHLASQVRRLRLDDPALALRLFKSNREAGLLLFVALVAASWS